MKNLKQYINYIKESGLILAIGILLTILIYAIVDATYSIVALASISLIIILIFSIKDFVYKKKNNYICYKLRK